jgi:diguanylate cyclase (GGDEF)-like protein/PAS domain S-box-containing protein
MNAPATRILIVDDEARSMRALRDTLRVHGYDTDGYTSGDDALRALRDGRYDLLLSDLMMPGMDGVALLTAALAIDPHLVGVMMTGMGTIETAVQAMQAGALDYVQKPIKLGTLLPVLARAVEVRRLRQENMELRDKVTIHELNEAMAHTLDRDVLLARIAEAAMAQFQADEASVMLVTDDGSALQVAAVRGGAREALLGMRAPVAEGIAGWVAAHREPLVLIGEVDDARWRPQHPRPQIQSALSMPMISRNNVIGVINVNCIAQRRTFPQGQVKMLGIFTNAAAASIEAAQMHDARRKADARYREVLQMAADGIVSIDDRQRIVVFSGGAAGMFGYRADEVIGQPLDILLPREAVDVHRLHVHAFAAGPDQSRATAGNRLHGRRKDGTLFNVEVGISRRSEDGVTLCTAVIRDVTLRIQQEDRIERLSRLYAVLSGVNTTIVRVTDETELYGDLCRIAVQRGGFKAAFVGIVDAGASAMTVAASAGLALDGRRFAPESPSISFDGILGRAIERNTVVWESVRDAGSGLDAVRSDAIALGARAVAVLPFVVDDAVRAVMIVHSATPDAFGDGEVNLLRELAGDVSFALDHLARKERLDYLATHDVLTGLPNRSLFLDRLAQAIKTAREKHAPLAVVLGDVERFKHLNDALGRHAGDALLRMLAERIRNAVEDGASLARVSGDVFALIFTDFTAPAHVAKTILRRTASVTGTPFAVAGQQVNVAMRVGSAFFPADGGDAEALFQNAEAALKRAKDLHEPLVFYTPDLNARVAERLAIESRLRRALERDEFILHYQPKVDMRTGVIVGLEALIRWQNPEVGLVPAAQFVTLLEETGLILDAGRWAMQEAVRAGARLRAVGLAPGRIAVNVSSIQLRQHDFVRSVEEAIAIADPHGLDLEITESVIMHDIDANVRKLNEVRAMGVDLAIDDFGTGYSSLAYIARLPISVVKIDRSFVNRLAGDSVSESIVATIISLTHALNRKAVAEGVETETQAALLRKLGCDQYQGYLFSKPVSLADVEQMLMAPVT